ncbi:uncharacterized protein [Arachis hypogaea]|uniref:uncharacterized protein n=1 Tax=Arachis hypogaea TaxID=3818 RepID=UPI003B2246CF
MNGSNYGDWSRALTLALQSKNKFDFVDGTITKPLESDPLFKQWKCCNTYVVGWINLSLSPDISRSVMWNNLAYEIWSELRRRYYHGDRFRIAELKEELYAAKQRDLSITTYFTKLRSLWEELESFQPVPICECTSRCSCGLGVIQAYRSEGCRRKSRTYGGKGSGRGKIVCTYCGKLEHTIDVCYRKHGLPPHLKERYNSGGATTFNYAATDEHADEDSTDQKQQRSDEQCLEFTQD